MAESMVDNIMNRHTVRNYERSYEFDHQVLEKIVQIVKNSPSIGENNDIEIIVCSNRAVNQKATDEQMKIFPPGAQAHLNKRVEEFGVENVMSCDASAEFIIIDARKNRKFKGEEVPKSDDALKKEAEYEEKVRIDAGFVSMAICIAARAYGFETMCQGVMAGKGAAKVYGVEEDSIILGVAVGKARPDAHISARKYKNAITYL